MANAEPAFGIPEMPMISPQVANLIPFAEAHRLKSVAIGATATEITILSARADDPDALMEIRALTGRDVVAVETRSEDIDHLLRYLSGDVEDDALWLQGRHITALSRLADTGLNLGQGDAVRSLLDRALEFAPFSLELWLAKARTALHRSEVIEALRVAEQIAPGDQRINRWLQSLRETDEREQSGPIELLSWTPQPIAVGEPSAPSSRASRLADKSFQAAREISALRTIDDVLSTTAQSLQELTGADSVSVYVQKGREWTGHSTSSVLQGRLKDALPKSNRVAAQALKQGLPVVVADTSSRRDDIGPLIAHSDIKSFVLIPMPRKASAEGLAYINYGQVDRAGAVFDPDLNRAVEVVLSSSASMMDSLSMAPKSEPVAPVDELTNCYTMGQFNHLLAAEVERARRYRFSVSIVLLEIHSEGDLEPAAETVRLAIQALQSAARGSDIVARGQGTRYAVLLPQTTASGAALVARRLEAALHKVTWTPGAEGRVFVSATTFPDNAASATELFEAATSDLTIQSQTSQRFGLYSISTYTGDS